jgi:hypothetical protein
MFNFGSGTLWGTPAGGNLPTNPTPLKFGVLQDNSLDISYEIKELFGQKQFPEAIARGKGKIAGKAKFGRIYSDLFNQLMFAQTRTTGMKVASLDEVLTAGGSVSVLNASSFLQDQGVLYADTGAPLLLAASGSPTDGEYTVSPTSGTYTFSSGDAGKPVQISYLYLVATGVTQQISNQLMGYQPIFTATFYTTFQGKSATTILYNCVASKLSMASKQDDFTIPEMDYSAFADASGRVVDFYTSE